MKPSRLLLLLASASLWLFSPPPCLGTIWYVDNQARGTESGRSWPDAWKTFQHIVWGPKGVAPGDTLYISGGTRSKTYHERLVIGASGTREMPIFIRVGQEEGHTGRVVLDADGASAPCIRALAKSYIRIDGRVGSASEPRLKVMGSAYSGVAIERESHGFRLSYIEATANKGYGIRVLVDQDDEIGEIDHCVLHDDGIDELWALGNRAVRGSRFGCLKIHHNDIFDWHADAVKISLHGVDFFENKIHDRGVWYDDHPDGIQAWSSYLRIYNNEFYNFLGTGDHYLNSYIRYNPEKQIDVDPSDVLIYNNLFFETMEAPAGSYFRGIELEFCEEIRSARRILVANNVLKGVPYFALRLEFARSLGRGDVSDFVVENNLFQDVALTRSASFWILSGGDGTITYGSHGSEASVVVDYNGLYASLRASRIEVSFRGQVLLSYDRFRAASGCQTHDVTANPLLDGAWRPTAQSPLIGAGVDLSAFFTTDKGLAKRPKGSKWDIGAYQYGGHDTTRDREL